MSQEKDVAYLFARNVAKTRFEDVPADAVGAAKAGFLDTLGVMLAASGAYPSVSKVVDFVKETGGEPTSTIVAFGGKVPPYLAALANASMSHSLDYDDIDYETTYHPSSVVIPAVFAIAEKVHPVSGKDFITAVALAHDLGIRLAASIPAQRKPPWHRTVVLGTFAAAAACAKVLKLDEESIVDALGLAFVQASGTLELRWGVGSDIGGMYSAFPAKAGVLAAQLAQKKVSGIKSPFEGRAGLFITYFDGNYKREKLVDGLGKDFVGGRIAHKPWPACGGSLNYVSATLSLLKEHKIKVDDIESVTVYVGDFANTLCVPLAGRQKPAAVIDAKFSIPFTVAAALVKGNVVIDDFTVEAIKDKKVLALAAKVTPKLDARFDIKGELPAGAVEVKVGGQTFYKEVAKPYGHPENPLSWKALSDKFRDCAAHAVKPLPAKNVDKVIDFINNLEKARDVAEIGPWVA